MGLQVQLIWNKGIAALCDRRFPDEFPDGENYVPVPKLAGSLASRWLPDDLISDRESGREIRDNEVVWVRLSWLKSFEKHVLPFVSGRLTLVTADSDSSVPSDLGSLAGRILRSSKVRHWYTQNYDGSAPLERVSPIPIGMDFHMLSEKPMWAERMSSPLEQQQSLLAIRSLLPPLRERIPRVYVDFGWQRRSLRDYLRFHHHSGRRFRESRSRTASSLRNKGVVFFQSGPLPRSEMWKARGQYAFVLSPHGRGLDCHRTWEALALGHIVLVPSSSLDALFVDLPVVPLRSWSEINAENLERWLLRYQGDIRISERLKSCYWVNSMRTQGEAAGAG